MVNRKNYRAEDDNRYKEEASDGICNIKQPDQVDHPHQTKQTNQIDQSDDESDRIEHVRRISNIYGELDQLEQLEEPDKLDQTNRLGKPDIPGRPDIDDHFDQSGKQRVYDPKLMSSSSPNPWDSGFDQADQSRALSNIPPKIPSENRPTIQQVQRSKDRTVLGLIMIVVVLLAACGALAGVSIALPPWWKHSREVPTTHEWIHIGLWEGCFKDKEDGDWLCNSYDLNDKTQSPNTDIEILQYLSIVGAGISALALLLIIVSIFLKKYRKVFRFMLYFVAVLCFISAAVLGVVIGLVTDTTKAKSILPSDIQLKSQVTGENELKFGIMFFLMCAAGGCVFLALVFTAVVLFVHDDLNLSDLKYDDDEEDEQMDDDGFQLEERKIKKMTKKQLKMEYIDYVDSHLVPGPYQNNGHPDNYDNYVEPRQGHRNHRRSRDYQDFVYTNPAFHNPSQRPLSRNQQQPRYDDEVSTLPRGSRAFRDMPHNDYRYPRQPPSIASSGRISAGHHLRPPPKKPPRQQRYISEDERSNYEDYEMYFNAPY